MVKPISKLEGAQSVRVIHDKQRQVLEILSLFRVMNNYYNKKMEIQNQIQPILFNKFKESIEKIIQKGDWLHTIPTALNTLSEDLLGKRDSFRFPDSIILFESWINLGLQALYPRIVLHFKFPGLLKGEKTRNVFQFIFSTSRGFGFPIYFGPKFYNYETNYLKYIEPVLKWSYTVCHRANQAIRLVNKRLKSKRHHPGDFESVIISEYKNNVFRGINTLLHGYFTGIPRKLGTFSSLEEALSNVAFCYTIGDHAMSVKKVKSIPIPQDTKEIPLLTHNYIVKKYEIDFFQYLKKLMDLNRSIIRKIVHYKRLKKEFIKKLNLLSKLRFYLENLIPFKKLSKKFYEVRKYIHYTNLLEVLREFLWISPLYTHTIHSSTNNELYLGDFDGFDESLELDQESSESIFFKVIKKYELLQDFTFNDEEMLQEIKELRDYMAKMWLYFKERHFRYAVKKLNELASLSLDDKEYNEKVKKDLDHLIPIISIYEIFNRPLVESVYPESTPHIHRLGNYLARFFTSRFNPIGINLMNIFNKLAYYNWIFLIKNQKLNLEQFFYFILKLPIWKSIPTNVKNKVLSNNPYRD
ncbi:MAG: hypothetical protein ACFFAO_01695 [Candidatus Hermodarchaeota archaeon]